MTTTTVAPQCTKIDFNSSDEVYSPAALPDTAQAQALERAGYVQEEYFLSGFGAIYRSGQDLPELEHEGIPYTTRILVVRPRDAGAFNGVVHLTGMHPFLGGVQWNWAEHLVLSTGAAFVAVATGTDAKSRSQSTAENPIAGPWVTKWFDSQRYAPLHWPTDDGIRWSVLADTAKLLRSPERSFLADLGIERIFCSGWSFLGSFQRTYINEGFHDLFRAADGGPLIDGYAIGISSPWQQPGYLPINSHTPVPPLGDARRTLRPIDVPVIEFLSQNEGQANYGAQIPDIDQGLGRHRLYEVAGASHRDTGVPAPRTYRQQLKDRNHSEAVGEYEPNLQISDVPVRLLFAAAMQNLDSWVRESVPPPPGAQLRVNRAQQIEYDEFGNPRGGVRSVQLDVPLARYGAATGRTEARYTPQYLQMLRTPLEPSEIEKLYPGGLTDYLEQARQRVQQMVAQRWLRAADEELYLQELTNEALKVFTVEHAHSH